MSAPRRIAIFPALVRGQTLAGCERRLFLLAVYMGALPGIYGGLFAQRLWMMALGVAIFIGLVALFAVWTKQDAQYREVIVNTSYYRDRYAALARWDRKPKMRRYT